MQMRHESHGRGEEGGKRRGGSWGPVNEWEKSQNLYVISTLEERRGGGSWGRGKEWKEGKEKEAVGDGKGVDRGNNRRSFM